MKRGHLRVIQLLLEYGAGINAFIALILKDTNIVNSQKKSPLWIACTEDDKDGEVSNQISHLTIRIPTIR